MLNKDNVRELISAAILPILVDLAVLAHLHVQRAKVQNQVCTIVDSYRRGRGTAETFGFLDECDRSERRADQ